ncbi:peptidase S9 prolyl oligopeptidase active site domain protein [mine drainage metagenome]|uniref:Peptidase S9 prolyl oligopeptidase active site domain protein n=1 Tax=mine drainage metagenome TaxID=410659 RepID=T0YJF0_9ZZZZ
MLAFLSDCASGQRAQQDIVLLDVARAGALPHQITHLDGLVRALRWAPDDRALGFLYIPGDTRRADALASTGPQVGVIGQTNIEHQRVAQVAAQGGTPQLLTPEGLFVYEFDYSPQARRIAYVAAPPPGADHWWVAQLYVQPTRADARPRAVVDPNTVAGPLHGLQIALPRFAPDGRRIAFIGGLMSDQGATGGDVYLVSAEGGAPVDLTPGIGVTPSWFAWAGAHALLVNAFAGGSSQLATLRIDGGHGQWQPLRTMHAALGDGTAMSALALAAQGDALAWIQGSFETPPEVWTSTLRRAADGGIAALAAPRAITQINAGIRPLWGKSVSLHWSNQGFHVQGWLLYPANYDPHQRYPLIVSVHGGPSWAVQPRWPGVNYGGAPLSAMGYFVLFPNPRGSFGQGERFAKAVRRDMGYGDLRDILAGVKQVEARFPVDPRRVGITGWSYGGFMSMFAPTQTHVFRAAVAGAGLSDWLSYNGENSIDAWMKPFFGASVYDDPAVYARSSAINFIRQDKTPTLMVVGEFDAESPGAAVVRDVARAEGHGRAHAARRVSERGPRLRQPGAQARRAGARTGLVRQIPAARCACRAWLRTRRGSAMRQRSRRGVCTSVTAPCTHCAASTLPCGAARCSPCSVPMVPARPRCSRFSPPCSSPARARRACSVSIACANASRCASAWASCFRSRRWRASCRYATTCI